VGDIAREPGAAVVVMLVMVALAAVDVAAEAATFSTTVITAA
jgi:hypothetical protein